MAQAWRHSLSTMCMVNCVFVTRVGEPLMILGPHAGTTEIRHKAAKRQDITPLGALLASSRMCGSVLGRLGRAPDAAVAGLSVEAHPRLT